MEWLLGVQRGNRVVARCAEVAQRGMEQLLGVQRGKWSSVRCVKVTQRGCGRCVQRGTEWLLGAWTRNGAIARCIKGAQGVTECAQKACVVEWNCCQVHRGGNGAVTRYVEVTKRVPGGRTCDCNDLSLLCFVSQRECIGHVKQLTIDLISSVQIKMPQWKHNKSIKYLKDGLFTSQVHHLNFI